MIIISLWRKFWILEPIETFKIDMNHLLNNEIVWIVN